MVRIDSPSSHVFISIPTLLLANKRRRQQVDVSLLLSSLLAAAHFTQKKILPGTRVQPHMHNMPTPRPKQPTALLLPPPPLYENNHHLHTPHADSHEMGCGNNKNNNQNLRGPPPPPPLLFSFHSTNQPASKHATAVVYIYPIPTPQTASQAKTVTRILITRKKSKKNKRFCFVYDTTTTNNATGFFCQKTFVWTHHKKKVKYTKIVQPIDTRPRIN